MSGTDQTLAADLMAQGAKSPVQPRAMGIRWHIVEDAILEHLEEDAELLDGIDVHDDVVLVQHGAWWFRVFAGSGDSYTWDAVTIAAACEAVADHVQPYRARPGFPTPEAKCSHRGYTETQPGQTPVCASCGTPRTTTRGGAR